MFAAIVKSQHDVMALAATLSALVEGSAAGLIGHAVVILPHKTSLLDKTGVFAQARHELERLCDVTGADIVTASPDGKTDWQNAALVARGDWVVTLSAGEVFTQGWIAAIERHAMTSRGKAGLIPATGWRGFGERIGARLFPRRISSGYVLPRQDLIALNAVALAGPAGKTGAPVCLEIRRLTIG